MTQPAPKGLLVLLDGPSCSGKSELLNYAYESCPNLCKVLPKETTRAKRFSDSSWEFKFVDHITDSLVDYSFNAVGHQYAFDIVAIADCTNNELVSVATCTDKMMRSKLVKIFNTCSLYVHRDLSDALIRETFDSRGIHNQSEIASRIEEIQNSKNNYIKNITDYDKVILNTGSVEQLQAQFVNIIEHYGYKF